MTIGDALTIEGGATAQHIIDGANDLIAQDPAAYWNTATNTVVSTQNPSPRIVVLPVYDPLYFDQGKRIGNFTQVRISNFVGFFVDHVEANNVVGLCHADARPGADERNPGAGRRVCARHSPGRVNESVREGDREDEHVD